MVLKFSKARLNLHTGAKLVHFRRTANRNYDTSNMIYFSKKTEKR